MKKAEPKFVVDARKFLEEMGNELAGKKRYWDIAGRVFNYNKIHGCNYNVSSGSARACIIGENFVVKFDTNKTQWGNNLSELRAYNSAKQSGHSHLFSEMRKIKVNNHYFYVMEKVYDIDSDNDYYYNVAGDFGVEEEDCYYIENYFNDLHGGNYGFDKEGNLKIIDYACHCLPM